MSLARPTMTPGVAVARLQTLRPLSGSSAIACSLIVCDTVAESVASIGAEAVTINDSARAPTCITAFVRTTWLLATSTPVTLNV